MKSNLTIIVISLLLKNSCNAIQLRDDDHTQENADNEALMAYSDLVVEGKNVNKMYDEMKEVEKK